MDIHLHFINGEQPSHLPLPTKCFEDKDNFTQIDLSVVPQITESEDSRGEEKNVRDQLNFIFFLQETEAQIFKTFLFEWGKHYFSHNPKGCH